MGNCCCRIPIREPNEPLSPVHIPNTFRTYQLSGSSEVITISSRTSQNGLHLSRSSSTSNGSPRIIRGRRRSQTQRRSSDVRSNTLIYGNASQPCCFGYRVMRDATNNFNRKNLIGVGGFAHVYKGHIGYVTDGGTQSNRRLAIAVKRLDPFGSSNSESWKTEVNILSELRHPNIIQLLGYCREGQHKMVVYEYMHKGSLAYCLFQDGGQRGLSWRIRKKIAIGAAKGLAYLHTNSKIIIHRDVKASNVLLDSKFNAKISDFGLARHGPMDENDHVSTRVIGTQGYFAPEYFKSGHLTIKADVYSFGVVLLEILTGTCVDKKCPNGVAGDLVQRSKPLLSTHTESDLRQIIDARIRRNIPMEEARRFAEVTYRCLNEDPMKRPTMNKVVESLENLKPEDCDLPRGRGVSFRQN